MWLDIVTKENNTADASIVRGTLLKKAGLKSKTFYTITAKSGKPVIALSLGSTVNANQCYILKEDMENLGLTESQYAINFDKFTGIEDIENTQAQTGSDTYDLQGRKISADSKGIIIKNHKTILNK